MPRVVPSQVVAFINNLWPSSGDLNNLHRGQAGQLSGLVNLVDQIPSELLVMDAASYALFVCGRAHISQKLVTWAGDPSRGHELGLMPGPTPKNPVTEIRDALAKCADESPSHATSALNFIADVALRKNLLIEISEVTRALANGEWKAATVLAGSAAEALLLWALKQRPPAEITSAIATLHASGGLTTNPNSNLDRWNLYEFIQVAENIGVINPNTATQTRLAKDFRNFIHPGVAQRLGEKCDRATALSAVAGMEHVVRDLTP